MDAMDSQMATRQLVAALESTDVSVRLTAALKAGSRPLPDYVEALVERCAIEPDFFVRDMLSWALRGGPPPASSRKQSGDDWPRTWPRSSGAVGVRFA